MSVSGISPSEVRRLRILLQDRTDDGLDVVAVKGTPAGQQFVEDDSKRPDIRPLIDGLTPGLLGRHIGDGAHHLADLGVTGFVGQLGQAEIEQIDRAVAP